MAPKRPALYMEPVTIVGRVPPQDSGVSSFEDAPGAWDTLYVNGQALPGLVTIGGPGFERRVQKTASAGHHGASVTDLGHKQREFKISLRMWTTEHLRSFEKLLPRLTKPQPKQVRVEQRSLAELPTAKDDNLAETIGKGLFNAFARDTQAIAKVMNDPKTKPVQTQTVHVYEPVEVAHPAFRLFGIKTVSIISVGLPEHGGDGVWHVQIACTEHVLKRTADVAKASKVSLSNIKLNQELLGAPPSSTEDKP